MDNEVRGNGRAAGRAAMGSRQWARGRARRGAGQWARGNGCKAMMKHYFDNAGTIERLARLIRKATAILSFKKSEGLKRVG